MPYIGFYLIPILYNNQNLLLLLAFPDGLVTPTTVCGVSGLPQAFSFFEKTASFFFLNQKQVSVKQLTIFLNIWQYLSMSVNIRYCDVPNYCTGPLKIMQIAWDVIQGCRRTWECVWIALGLAFICIPDAISCTSSTIVYVHIFIHTYIYVFICNYI